MDPLLEQYNPHWSDRKAYDQLIEREFYTKTVLGFLGRPEIIVLKGIRRCGKSSLLKLIIRELLKKKVKAKNILFMNLEDYRFGSDKDSNTLEAIYQSYMEQVKPEGRVYLLLDEIQEVRDFERWLRTHYEQGDKIKFIVSGSSSSLFSTELATLLTGRQISREVFPFSFGEYLAYRDEKTAKSLAKKNIDTLYMAKSAQKIEAYLEDYLSAGGFPEVLKHESPENNQLLLQQYISDIILRDVARRHNIRKIEVLQKLALYLIYNIGTEVNISRTASLLGSNRTTILELISYLNEVYLIFSSPSFAFNIEDQLSSTRSKRVYCIDNGFYTAISTEAEAKPQKRLKNTIYQHLRFHWGREVCYWRDKVEVEFILPDGFPVGVCTEESRLDNTINQLYHYMGGHNIKFGLLVHSGRLQILDENGRKLLLLPMWLFLLQSEADVREYIENQ